MKNQIDYVCPPEEIINHMVSALKSTLLRLIKDRKNYIFPATYSEHVGDKAEFPCYVILSREFYEKLNLHNDLPRDYGITEENIGQYVFMSPDTYWLLTDDNPDDLEDFMPDISLAEQIKKSIENTISECFNGAYDSSNHISRLFHECVEYKALEALNKSLEK